MKHLEHSWNTFEKVGAHLKHLEHIWNTFEILGPAGFEVFENAPDSVSWPDNVVEANRRFPLNNFSFGQVEGWPDRVDVRTYLQSWIDMIAKYIGLTKARSDPDWDAVGDRWSTVYDFYINNEKCNNEAEAFTEIGNEIGSVATYEFRLKD